MALTEPIFLIIMYSPDLVDGEYTGHIIDANGCEVSESSIIVNTATSNPNLDQLDLFPNPTYTDITLGSENSIKFQYEIIDITGKIVSQNSGSSNVPISVEQMPPGLYLVKVNQKNSFKVFKLSKL